MPYAFGMSSNEKLSQCDHRLVKVAERVIKVMDFKVLEGHRDQATQDKYFKEGKSKLKWPNGKHNKLPSLAIDVVPYPVDFSDKPKAIARFYLLGGLFLMAANELGIKLRCGFDWDGDFDLNENQFDDLGHFELVD